MRRAILAALIGGVLSSCASTSAPKPTPQHPIVMCAITCPNGRGDQGGFLFRAQHVCRGVTRWFEDLRVIGEFIHRNEADGTIELAVWIACVEGWTPSGQCTKTADYPQVDVIRRPCSSAIQDIVQSRDPEQRGVHPGEHDPLHPNQRRIGVRSRRHRRARDRTITDLQTLTKEFPLFCRATMPLWAATDCSQF